MSLSKEKIYFQCLSRIVPGDLVDFSSQNADGAFHLFMKVLVLGIQSKWLLLGGIELKDFCNRNTGWNYMRCAYPNEFKGPDQVRLIANLRTCENANYYAWIKKIHSVQHDGYQILKIYKQNLRML